MQISINRPVDRAVEIFDAKPVDVNEIIYTNCDILAPCALGAVISVENIHLLKCKAVAGSANNVLKDEAAGDMLKNKGIIYAPDYIINAGGVINVAEEIDGNCGRSKVLGMVDNIYNTIASIIIESKSSGKPEYIIAEELAMKRIRAEREKH